MSVPGLLLALVLAVAARPAGAAPADSLAIARRQIEVGDFAEAEALLRRLIVVFEARSSRDSLAQAVDRVIHILCWGERDRDPEVARLTARALALRDTSIAAGDPRAATALMGCAFQLRNAGRTAEAAALGTRIHDLLSRHPGPDSLDYTHGLHSAIEFVWAPDDPRVVAAWETIIRIRSRVLGASQHSLRSHWTNLGATHQVNGDFTRARAAFERSLRIAEGALSPRHPDIARGCTDLAHVLLALGDYAGARTLYDRALRLRLAVFGNDHPEVANSLTSLAAMQRRLGNLGEARRHARRALAIRERHLGPAHAHVATSLLQAALIEIQGGDFAAAAALAGRAVAIREPLHGRGHPVTALAYDGLARALIGLGRGDSAEVLARRAVRVANDALGEGHPELARSHETLAEACAAAGRDGEAIEAALRCEEIARGHLVKTLGRLTELEALQYEAVRTTGLDLAVRLAARPTADASARRRVWDAVVRSRGRALEELGAKLRGRPTLAAGLDAVIAALPPGAALVSYVRCETTAAPIRRRAEYVAFVHTPDGAIEVRPLGDAVGLDSAIGRWRSALHGPAAALEGRLRGEEVRRRLWDPVAGACAAAARVFVVPDGRFGSINFYTLPARGGGYLVEERRTIELLSAERRLARPRLRAETGHLLAVGGIDYGVSPSTLHAVARSGGSRWAPLARSGIEAREIALSWRSSKRATSSRRATILSGREATLDNLAARVTGAEVLHIATHGVFAGEGVDPLKQLRTGRREAGSVPSVLVRSGVVLAPDPAASREAARTGFLSAADVTRLDLSATRWVVLSGCETGAGRHLPRADLLGLRTAFEMAGARVVITSFGRVEDRWAHEWMRHLYHERYRNGLPTAAAVRRASLRLLEERRRLGLPDDPRAWGAFVALGLDD